MVVVAISGALAALAVPNFFDAVRKQRARSQIERVTQTLRLARNQARTTLCNVSVDVNASAGTITIGPEATSGDCAALSTVQDTFDLTLVEFKPASVNGATVNPFVFERRGATPYNFPGVFEIVNKVTGATVTYRVWPAIGTVELVR